MYCFAEEETLTGEQVGDALSHTKQHPDASVDFSDNRKSHGKHGSRFRHTHWNVCNRYGDKMAS